MIREHGELWYSVGMLTSARWARAAVASALLLLTSRTASAHDDPGRTEGASRPEGATGEHEVAEKEEPPWEVILDLDIGATTSDVLTGGPSTRNPSAAPANVFDSTRITAGSLLAGVERHLGERFTVGVRVPLVYAELTSRTGRADDRSTSAIGNVEVEGAFVLARGEHWNLTATLELALPTAGGREAPTAAEVSAEPEKRYAYSHYDTFAAVHAAAATRGAYESALFEPDNLGIIPKLSARFDLGKVTLTPMVKLENLIDVSKEDDEVYINELVAGVRAGYRVARVFEPGVHVWVRELHEHSHSDDSFSTVGVLEPYARFHLGTLQPSISAIVPFAGDLADDKTFGIRASIAGEF
ncbi:MAG: hypothetical protein JWP97_824 [Labilithrix sp.]|nr:hypothetical protein [Labilithrix sp.]